MVNWWPWYGGNSVYINNNFGNYTPNYTHCCGGRNSLFEKMIGFSFLNNILNSTMNNVRNIFQDKNQQQAIPPYACQYYPTMYPGLYWQNGLGGAGMTAADGLGGAQEQKNDYMIMQSLARTNNLSIVGPSSEGEYYLKAKGKKPIKFSSFDELKQYMEEKYTTSADDVQEEDDGKKPAKAAESEDDESTKVKVKGSDDTEETDKPKETDKSKKTDDPKDDNDKKSKLTYSSNYKKENWNAHLELKFLNAKNDLSAKGILNNYLNNQSYNYSADDESYKNLLNDFIKRNPTWFNDNGSAKIKKDEVTEELRKKLDIPLNHKIVSEYKLTKNEDPTPLQGYNKETKFVNNKIVQKHGSTQAIFIINNKEFKLVYDNNSAVNYNIVQNNLLDRNKFKDNINGNYHYYFQNNDGSRTGGELVIKDGKVKLKYNNKYYDMNNIMNGSEHW